MNQNIGGLMFVANLFNFLLEGLGLDYRGGLFLAGTGLRTYGLTIGYCGKD